MINIDQLAAAVPHFAAAARASGTAPRAFFITSVTGTEVMADSALVAKVDAVLATSGLKRREPGSFAPGGFAGVKAPADSNTPRVTGEGCIFCEWA